MKADDINTTEIYMTPRIHLYAARTFVLKLRRYFGKCVSVYRHYTQKRAIVHTPLWLLTRTAKH